MTRGKTAVDFHRFYRDLLSSNSFAGRAESKAEDADDMSTHHRSLQRPHRVSRGPAEPGSPGPETEARVVWLGRSGDAFVAASPHSHFAFPPAHQRIAHQPYEISHELIQHQVTVMEQRYGGARKAHQAAVVIQRFYRKHCLARRFQQLSSANGRRRVLRVAVQPHHGPKTSSGALARPGGPVASQLRLHRYPQGEAPDSARRGSSPLLHTKAASSSRIQVRVSPSQAPSSALYYQQPPHSPAPPNVRVKAMASHGGQRSSSAERNHLYRVHRSAVSASGLLRSQGASAELQSHGHHRPQAYPISQLIQRQEAMYEGQLDLAERDRDRDPYGVFLPAPASPASSSATDSSHDQVFQVSAWSYRDSAQLGSPALPRRWPGPDSPSSTSSDSSPSSHGQVGLPPSSRLVSGPLRRSSESPIQVIRASAAGTTPSTSRRAAAAHSPSPVPRGQPRDRKARPSPVVDREREAQRKRQYRVALNFFNQKPERGMQLLIKLGFTEDNPASVAKFLLTRRGLAKAMVGDYLGRLGDPFCQAVLECFVGQVGMGGQELDEALRHFLTLFRLPGEAQKIERVIQVFAAHYCRANAEHVARVFRDPETTFVLAFAIIMLNTDLHTPSLKEDKRMKLEDFVKNLKGIDAGEDIEPEYLRGIYARVKEGEFRPGSDHLTQVLKVDKSILASAKKPSLTLPHRRLVCYCRLYEVDDPARKQAANLHQRELFLFNDLLVVTKLLGKGRKGATVSYTFRQAIPLLKTEVREFKNQHYPYGLKLTLGTGGELVYFQAKSEDDRRRFLEDLKEAILESEEMERQRIQLEMEKQQMMRPNGGTLTRSEAQRDSGLAEEGSVGSEESASPVPLRQRALSSSTLELCPELSVETVGVPLSPSRLLEGRQGTLRPESGRGREPRPAVEPPPPPPHGERRHSLNSDSGISNASAGSRESSPKTSVGVAAQLPPYPLSARNAPSTKPLAALFGKGK